MPQEVWSWPEATLYFFTGGESPAAIAFADDVQLTVRWEWLRRQTLATGASFVNRTRRTLTDKRVVLSVGALHYTAADLFLRPQSATAYNAALSASSYDGIWRTAGFSLWSAVFTDFTLQGQQQGGIFRARVSMEGDDISGY